MRFHLTGNYRLLHIRGGKVSMAKERKNSAAVALGRLGGKVKVSKGLARISKKRRSEIARQGAAARWAKKGGNNA